MPELNQPSNILVGDQSPVDLPQMPAEQLDITEERNKARYTRTKEFKKIQKHCQERIALYQQFFPDGRAIGNGKLPTPEDWVIANTLIMEFTNLMNIYETANDVVKAVDEQVLPS